MRLWIALLLALAAWLMGRWDMRRTFLKRARRLVESSRNSAKFESDCFELHDIVTSCRDTRTASDMLALLNRVNGLIDKGYAVSPFGDRALEKLETLHDSITEEVLRTSPDAPDLVFRTDSLYDSSRRRGRRR